jgi:hypothetical protein
MVEEFNEVVQATALALSIEGVDQAEIAATLVVRFGSERAFLLFHAALVYARMSDPPPPSGSNPEPFP